MKTTSHVYSIDLIGILNSINDTKTIDKLAFYSLEKKEEFIEQHKIAGEEFLGVDSAKLKELMIRNVPYVIVPSEDGTRYQYWFGLRLCLGNPQKIPLLLDWHWKQVNQEEWFLNHVEFSVLRSIESNTFFDTSKRQKLILQWVILRRNIRTGLKVYPEEFVVGKDQQNVHNNKFTSKPLQVSEHALGMICDVLNDFVMDSDRQGDLKKLLSGNLIERPIRIKGTRIFFVAMITLLIESKNLNYSKRLIAPWLNENFLFKTKDGKNFKRGSELNYLRCLSTKYHFSKAEEEIISPIRSTPKRHFSIKN